ncbi:MAG: response regulator [Candidatus Nomurabacteria bacterium]|nr:response regulator [Candidatus Nomurabacteria bacterium]
MLESIKILIVDDLELVHEPIKRFLNDFVFIKSKLIIDNVYNITQAKRNLTEGKYDLVMLDGDIGGSWGYEIIQDIVEHNDKTIVISISNHDDFNIKNVNAGAHEMVNKTYLYDWNDKEGVFRVQKAEVIMGIFERKFGKY